MGFLAKAPLLALKLLAQRLSAQRADWTNDELKRCFVKHKKVFGPLTNNPSTFPSYFLGSVELSCHCSDEERQQTFAVTQENFLGSDTYHGCQLSRACRKKDGEGPSNTQSRKERKEFRHGWRIVLTV